MRRKNNEGFLAALRNDSLRPRQEAKLGRAGGDSRGADNVGRMNEVCVREQHRADLLQVLAYANLASTSKVIACLIYPCSAASWNSLRDRGQLIHRAELTGGTRLVNLWLTAVPMATPSEQIAVPLVEELRRSLAN